MKAPVILTLFLFSFLSQNAFANPKQHLSTVPNCSMPSLGHSSNAECIRLGCFHDHCHLNESLEAVVYACQGNVDASCIRSLCLQRGDCAMLSRFTTYAEMCRF